MKHPTIRAALFTLASVISAGAAAEGSVQNFGQSVQHAGQSSQHAAGSLANTVVGSTKIVSGVAALPFKAVGKVGTASDAIGAYLWNNATGTQALEISDETVTAGPAPLVAVNQ